MRVQETDEHGGFAEPLAFHEAVVRNFHERVRRLVHGHARDVAARSVREDRLGMELHFVRRFDEHLLDGRDFDARERGNIFQIAQCTIRDPAAENGVFLGVPTEAQSALVREFCGGLEQEQALVRLHCVDAPARHFAGERDVIEVGVLSAQ